MFYKSNTRLYFPGSKVGCFHIIYPIPCSNLKASKLLPLSVPEKRKICPKDHFSKSLLALKPISRHALSVV